MAEYTNEEAKKLLEHFQKMNVKPDVDSFEAFKASMVGHFGQAESSRNAPAPPVDYKHHFPKLPPFSGDTKGKDVAYDIWKSEVLCISNEGYSTQTLGQAVRSSLRGEALRVWSRLGPDASVDKILQKMDSVYGSVQQAEMLLASFYSAKQESDENVSVWSCRLEDMLVRVVDAGEVRPDKMDSMLRAKFWTGLRPSLKDPTGHLYENIRDFDSLRVAIRRVEEDRRSRQPDSGKKKPETAKSATASAAPEPSEFSQLTGMIQQLATEVQSLKDQRPYSNQHRGYRNQNSRRGNQRQYGGNRNRTQDPQPQQPNQPELQQDADSEPDCYRCGRPGHIALVLPSYTRTTSL